MRYYFKKVLYCCWQKCQLPRRVDYWETLYSSHRLSLYTFQLSWHSQYQLYFTRCKYKLFLIPNTNITKIFFKNIFWPFFIYLLNYLWGVWGASVHVENRSLPNFFNGFPSMIRSFESGFEIQKWCAGIFLAPHRKPTIILEQTRTNAKNSRKPWV